MMERKDIIRNTVTDLIDQDYREGFNDGVIIRVTAALDEFDGSGSQFWNHMLLGRKNEAFEQFFGSDADLWDLYAHAEKISKGPGAFVIDPRDIGF